MSAQPESKGQTPVASPEQSKKHEFTDQTNLLPPRQVILVFLGIAMCAIIACLDMTIVATAIPTIGAHFNAGSTISWVPAANALTSTIFQPMFGRFSDIFGRKSTLMFALFLFAVGNLASGFSETIVQLIVLRAISGMGTGAVLGLSQIIISDVVSLRERGKYQGIIGGIIALGFALGPFLGGVLSEKASWRWCFWVTPPICLVAAPAIFFFVPFKGVEGDIKKKLLAVDYLGALLTLAGFTLIILPLNWGGVSFPWDSAGVLAPLFCGISCVALFILWEWKGASFPMVPLYIFKHTTVVGVYITMFMYGMISSSAFYYLPQFFQVNLNYSPIHSGVFLLPLLVMQTFTSFCTGQIVSRTGHYRFIVWSGFAVWTTANGLISSWKSSTATGLMVFYMLLSGCGAGQTLQTTTVAAQASVDRKDMAVVTSVRNFFRSLGSSFTLVIGASILNNALKHTMKDMGLPPSTILAIINDPTILHSEDVSKFNVSASQAQQILVGYTKGFRTVFILNASLSAVAIVAAVLLIKHKSLQRGDEDKLREEAKAWLEKSKEKGRDPEADVSLDQPEKLADVASLDKSEPKKSGEKL